MLFLFTDEEEFLPIVLEVKQSEGRDGQAEMFPLQGGRTAMMRVGKDRWEGPLEKTAMPLRCTSHSNCKQHDLNHLAIKQEALYPFKDTISWT